MPLRALSFISDLPILHRITDVEIMERRYPVILHRFGLREGSGGDGLHHGGEGVIREVEVSTRNVFLTLISSDAYGLPSSSWRTCRCLSFPNDGFTALTVWQEENQLNQAGTYGSSYHGKESLIW
jgi:hypothetical protein